MNYLTLLHKRKLSYSTINLHRSAISLTLANFDGAPLGGHPLITRLMKGVFTKRPPTRKVPSVWDPALVLGRFMQWSLPLSHAQLLRKCAFIFAKTSARRLSDLFSLKCIGKHIQINDDFVQFVPSSFSKKDHTLLTERVNLKICHDRLFFNIHRPEAEMSLESFRRCICWCLQDADIQASPGSMRATAASSALGRNMSMADILHLGNWSSSSTFLRFYTSL
jgi:hypothetical protein